MLRRVFSFIATAALASAGFLSAATPAQAAIVDIPFGPLSIGEYCAAKIHPDAWIGFYEASGLKCYTPSGSSGLIFRGTGDPYLACKHLTADVIMAALRGPSDGIVCRAVR
ncbi:hypothetical protein [Acrocarpospora sp. B8E8]|uniref:hypothetical protein n=1 Tax=Acrocarpospora sp. B8E8 TaxID=3153572 RepID=UPI00325E0EF1